MTSILDIYNNIFHSPKKNDTTKIVPTTKVVPTILTPVIIKNNNNNNNMTNISQQRLDNLNCVLGLDCSKWQPNITWSDAKTSGIQFAFVKITEGNTGHEDNLYNVKARILSAQQNGIKVGYYHFARPHESLRITLPEPFLRKGKQRPRLYKKMTPAMAAGLTSRRWSVMELISYPLP